jgi:sugar phosphate isomerase/epimerase
MPESVKLLASSWTCAGDASPRYSSPASPVDIFDRVRFVGQAGFKGIGLLDADLRAAREAHGPKVMGEVKAAAAAAGLDMIELEYLTGWHSPDPQVRAAADRKTAELLEWGAELGARQVKAGTAVAASYPAPADLGAVAADFERLCEAFNTVGTRVALEIHPWAVAGTPAAGLRVVGGVPASSGGLLIDIWHADRGKWDLSALEGEPGTYVVAVELADADREVRGTLMEDSMERRYCGDGDCDVPAFIGAIKRAGFNGYWGIEMLSQEHRKTPVEAGLRHVYDTTMRQFQAASA